MDNEKNVDAQIAGLEGMLRKRGCLHQIAEPAQQKLPHAEGADWFLVLCPRDGVVFAYDADLGRSFGHEHIKDAMEDDRASLAKNWVVRPAYAAPASPAQQDAPARECLQQSAEPLPTVELVGIKDGVETSLGPITMPPSMKARDLLREYGFGDFEDDMSQDSCAMAAMQSLIEYCQRYYAAPAAAALQAAPPAPEAVAVPAQVTKEMKGKGAEAADIKPSQAEAVFLAMLAAAPAQAVAVPGKALPYEPTSDMLIAARECDPALPIETVRAIYWAMWRTAPAAPAQEHATQLAGQGRTPWRSMETAPKDGTEVILFGPLLWPRGISPKQQDLGPTVHCGHWYAGMWQAGGWLPQPTHWMPFPDEPGTYAAAPVQAQEDARDAARYRFLRHADLDALAAANWGMGEVYEGEALDAAIDAAMNAGGAT